VVVSPGKPIPEGDPVSFTIRAEAPGFLPVQQDITIKGEENYNNLVFLMPEINSLPDGIIPVKNQEFKGFQYDATDAEIGPMMSNLITHNSQKISVNGRVSEEAFFPFQYASVQKTNGDNQPGNLELEIPAGTKDLVTNVIYREGDKVNVYRKDVQSDTWVMEKEVTLQKSASGNTKAVISGIRPGEIALAPPPNPTCSAGLKLTFSRAATSINTLHYFDIVTTANASNTTGTAPLASSGTAPVTVSNALTYQFATKLPANTAVTVRMWMYEVQPAALPVGAFRIVKSLNIPAASVCNNVNWTFDANTQQFTNHPVMKWNLDTYCSATKTVYYHDGRTQFELSPGLFVDMGLAKRTGTAQLQTLTTDYLSNPTLQSDANFSFLDTDKLPSNTKTYNFRSSVTAKPRTSNKVITKTYTRLRKVNLVEFSQSTGVNASLFPGGSYQFTRRYWFAPTTTCADFGY
jgi:hypothetical protein